MQDIYPIMKMQQTIFALSFKKFDTAFLLHRQKTCILILQTTSYSIRRIIQAVLLSIGAFKNQKAVVTNVHYFLYSEALKIILKLLEKDLLHAYKIVILNTNEFVSNQLV